PAADVGIIPAFIRSTFVMGKVTGRTSESNTLQASFVYTNYIDYNSSQFQSFNTRSREFQLRPVDKAVQFQWQRIAKKGTWLHDLKASYFPRDYPVDYQNVGGQPLVADGQKTADTPQVNITNVANFGGNLALNHQYTWPVQVVYSSTISKGKHNI